MEEKKKKKTSIVKHHLRLIETESLPPSSSPSHHTFVARGAFPPAPPPLLSMRSHSQLRGERVRERGGPSLLFPTLLRESLFPSPPRSPLPIPWLFREKIALARLYGRNEKKKKMLPRSFSSFPRQTDRGGGGGGEEKLSLGTRAV